MRDIHIRSLQAGDLPLAYPLVRSAARVEPERWLEFARGLIDGGGGILGAEAHAPCLYGLAAYRPLDTLRHRLVLAVELLVAIDFGSRQPVREALLKRLAEVARDHACASILLDISGDLPPGHAHVPCDRRLA